MATVVYAAALAGTAASVLYFIQALQMFYSAQELNDMLEDVGFRDVTNKTLFYGMLGFHRAVKPAAG